MLVSSRQDCPWQSFVVTSRLKSLQCSSHHSLKNPTAGIGSQRFVGQHFLHTQTQPHEYKSLPLSCGIISTIFLISPFNANKTLKLGSRAPHQCIRMTLTFELDAASCWFSSCIHDLSLALQDSRAFNRSSRSTCLGYDRCRD